ncbi:serine/threonine-protein kinase [Spirilliplanes yamanashiensis]|uniref:non-specific serine/threonine protein kinase n=1 Tax=Spirilliplanes yamanashiensis TaxID=42233 RepID=A0A8J4DK81_9ACTN|nr:serine/threonine-protein kinase [Spirilliplanes yamanashiensis]MDP9815764.1 serine/threonine-protein kinase [Spirilliplanes yamanashiensis]GIJ04018.1 hypothetical protein Sya03_33700 [Spirilliplanes yamanashiensis]
MRGHVGDGRYRLIERLGSGGMSVVWRARDEILHRDVAVKVLATKLADDEAFRQRIRVEALAAAKLAHPHVTAVHDYGEAASADGRTVPYVVMELVDGESLADRLARTGPLPWRDAVTAGAEVAAALACAHAHDVVHRDVTAQNVMLTAGGAKVVDFGISAVVGQCDSTPDGSLLGTPAYLAPERLAGGPVSPAADVYALGLLLYRALTGRLPWAATSTTEVLKAHLYTTPAPLPPLAGLPDAVAALVLRCLAKRPADRPTAAETARVLGAAAPSAARVPAPAAPAAPTLPGAAPAPRRPVLLPVRLRAAAATVGLLVAAGAGWAVASRSAADPGTQASAGLPGPGLAVAAPGGGRDCRIAFTVRRDTGAAFDAAVTVTNTGTERLTDWRLQFTFPGAQRIVADHAGAAGAVVGQTGRTVTVRPAGELSLAPGASADLPIRARYADTNPLPTAFAVDGEPCAATVSPGERSIGTVAAADAGKSARKARPTTRSSGAGAGADRQPAATPTAKPKPPRAKKPATPAPPAATPSPAAPPPPVEAPRTGGLYSVDLA